MAAGGVRGTSARMALTVHRIADAYFCIGSALRLEPHTPHAFTIVAASDGEIRVRFPAEARWQSCAAAVIAPGVAHELEIRGAAAMLFLGPETHDGRRFARRTILSDSGVPPPLAAEPRLLAHALVEQYAASRAPRFLDSRVREVLRRMRGVHGGRIAVPELAAAVALSPSRLVHLFHDQTRTTIKRYSLWLRLLAVLGAMHRETQVTQIAYRFGFADPSHLSRTFRTMLGMTPSQVVRAMPHRNESSISVLGNDRSIPFGFTGRE
jgi:AraC-like DNA-binding protein